MKATARRPAWKWLVRAILWNPYRSLRPILWVTWINTAMQFTPLWNAPWRIFVSLGIIAANGVWLLWFSRDIRRRKGVFAIYERQAGHWLAEMTRIMEEIQQAEERGVSFSRKLELSAKFEEAKTRFEREQALLHKSTS
jgi:hypothetical protein